MTMAHKVLILPSKREFMVQRNETVLEAALRSGLSLRYSCGNGSCGNCKGRIVDGRIGELLHTDHPLSEAERQDGQVLLCRLRPGSDMVIEASAAEDAADIPQQEIIATVSKLERCKSDVMIMSLRAPRSKTLRFLAGQHATLILADGTARNKSIASCPCNALVLQFHIRRAADDDFSEAVFGKLKCGDKITVQGPHGAFTFDEDSRRPMLLFAYETGFGPIKSIVEHALALEVTQPMHLYWLSGFEDGHYMQNYCRAWQDALDGFTYTPLLSAADSAAPADDDARRRAVDTAARTILNDHPAIAGYDVYLCGPEGVMGSLIDRLRERGLAKEQLHVDAMQRM
jgi:CDP-4-dehydro-6-deoxyglucose reductase